MVLRILLILAFVVPQVAAPATPAIATTARAAAPCPGACCCEVVETITCCGETVREMRCGRTGGACLCDAGDGAPAPAAPAPRGSDRRLAQTAFIAPAAVTVLRLRPARTAPVAGRKTAAPAPRNAQALLCIWRT